MLTLTQTRIHICIHVYTYVHACNCNCMHRVDIHVQIHIICTQTHTFVWTCSIASRCGLSSRRLVAEQWNSVEHRVHFSFCHFCASAGKQITSFDVGRDFHLSAIITVPKPKLQHKEKRPRVGHRPWNPLGRESSRKPLEGLHWRASLSSHWLHIRARDHPVHPLCVTSRQSNMSCSPCVISPLGRCLA